jgi:curved DNA-binding protein CbpA
MAPLPFTEDYYAILEVEQAAKSEQITQSYRRLALKLHPDRNKKSDTTAAFQLVCYVPRS